MTPEEKIKQIKELETQFYAKLEAIRAEYAAKIKDIVAEEEKKKIEALKKDLGM